MGNNQYTLEQLEQLSGFSKRQIRYYITKKLVPGAGNQRGPYAMYGEETRKRLDMIAVLKEQPTGPTGRTMTLAEIRHALDNIPELRTSETQDFDSIEECRSEWSGFRGIVADSASDYLKCEMDDNFFFDKKQAVSANMPMLSFSQSVDPAEEDQLDDLLQSLHSLLAELGSDTRNDKNASEGDSWRRITSPDVEIQVRTPDNSEARMRLKRMARQMGRLLAREE